MKRLLILKTGIFCLLVLTGTPAVAGLRVQQDTVVELLDVETNAVYKAPNGKVYHVSFEKNDEETAVNHPVARNASAAVRRAAAAKRAVANVACDHGNNFDAVYRKTAKLSIAHHKASSTSLRKLVTRLEAMDNAAITVSRNSARISMEDSVVTLISVYLYAIAREADEDYHIIIGTSANPATAKFFNIECSGLPAPGAASFSKLKKVRDKLLAFLGGAERCSGGYLKFDDHPKVKIIGSLLYDKEHESNIPGPASFKPGTAWELHPITEFKVL